MSLYSKDVYPLRIYYNATKETVIVKSEDEIDKNKQYTVLESVRIEDIPVSTEKPDA